MLADLSHSISDQMVLQSFRKTTLAWLLAVWIVTGAMAQTSWDPSATDSLVSYDSVLAKRLGADAYGMKAYVMAFLKAGPNRSADKAEAARLQQAHLENISRLAAEGKLVLAGPFLDSGPVRGIYIFDVYTLEEAEALTASDPAIQAGSLVMELHAWYGSATLPLINEWHEKIQKAGITEK
jgi:uncharacterized protein YciI